MRTILKHVVLGFWALAAGNVLAQMGQPSASSRSTITSVVRPFAALLGAADPVAVPYGIDTLLYSDTSLTACPERQTLKYFFYHQDIPDWRGPSWCGAVDANNTWANLNESHKWRLPYTVESCTPGVAFYYSHSLSDGSRFHSAAYRDVSMVCDTGACPVAELLPITDPLARLHEAGAYRPADLEHLDPAVREGSACIIRKAKSFGADPRITSGFRPHSYQKHLQEVWDKAAQLTNMTSSQCAGRRDSIFAHKQSHGLEYRPASDSRHSLGLAVHIRGVPQNVADQIAASCGMSRRVANDRVHYELEVKK